MVQSPYYNYRGQFPSVKIFRRRQIFVRLIFVGSADPRKFITHENFCVYGMYDVCCDRNVLISRIANTSMYCKFLYQL